MTRRPEWELPSQNLGLRLQRSFDIQARIDGGEWQDVRPGVQVQVLVGAMGIAQSTALLRYEPGARLARHRHAGLEQILVLRGTQADEYGSYAEGSLVLNAPGSSHTVFSRDGCIVLVTWHGDIEFE